VSPTPVSFHDPSAPAAYAWEATSEAVASRYGLDPAAVLRFDLNTSPTSPPGLDALLAVGAWHTPLCEYPPADYRLLVEAAASRYGVAAEQILVGAGADEILDLVAKAYLGPGRRAVLPVPTYAMYRVLTGQRGADVVTVPRRPVDEGFVLDIAATRRASAGADLVWLCDPNNPTGTMEPATAIEALLRGLAEDASSAGRAAPLVVIDEAYAEFVGRDRVELCPDYPDLLVVRTASKAFAVAGLRVGFGIADRSVLARVEPYRPPGSVSTISVTIVSQLLADPTIPAESRRRVLAERGRFESALRSLGLSVVPSATNFMLVDLESPAEAGRIAEGLLRQGLVPRTFPADHPLAGYLRLTVRTPTEDDRLVAAAARLIEEVP
jgi:histidinol-phosphate aminotransferase